MRHYNYEHGAMRHQPRERIVQRKPIIIGHEYRKVDGDPRPVYVETTERNGRLIGVYVVEFRNAQTAAGPALD